MGKNRGEGNKLKKGIFSFIFLCVILFVVIIFASSKGSVHVPFGDVIRIVQSAITKEPLADHIPLSWQTIILKLRIPRVILGALVGMALAASGAVYQGIFRNPLAEPYLIGVSSGASFGASLAIVFIWQFSLGGHSAITLAAFTGAMLAMFTIYSLSRVGGRTPITTLILAGIAISSILSAGTTFLMFKAKSAFHTIQVMGWLFGSLSGGSWKDIGMILPYLGIGFLLIILNLHKLNILQLDEHQAQSLGVNVEQTKIILIIASTLAAAAAVSVSGIIAFIGLIVPHVVRMIWGGDYRLLFPLSAISGAIALILADILARTLFIPTELPIGVVTALTGAPFFLYLLRKQKGDIM